MKTQSSIEIDFEILWRDNNSKTNFIPDDDFIVHRGDKNKPGYF